jgi:hypothetical protein
LSTPLSSNEGEQPVCRSRLIDNRKVEIFKAPALSGVFAYSHLSGALLVARNASAMSPIGPIATVSVVQRDVWSWGHDCSDCFRLERLPGGVCTHLYEGLACQDVFSRSTFPFLRKFQREFARGRSSALMATPAPLLGRAERSIPQSPEGRAGRREGLTAKARAERQWCLAPTNCDPFCVPVDPLPPLKGSDYVCSIDPRRSPFASATL